jgi:transposase InsO family protein
MRRRTRDEKAIALWRYEQIEEALATRSPKLRGPLLERMSRRPVVWPSGVTKPVSLASLYRWIDLYERGGLSALRPRRRKDKGRRRARIPAEVIARAVALLSDDPEISMTLLLALLRADPTLDFSGRGVQIARSTLWRRLAADPVYRRLVRTKTRERRRTRYVARKPHQIWHLDAKGPVSVRLVSGERLVFHIMSVLDDASRAVLTALVILSPDLCAAVRVFRLAAKRWGLPDLVYADRASIFDSVAFRTGLAELGSHRIKVRARNPEANGKIEAFHRVLVAWFTGRLARQRVVDLVHLQQLLEAVLETVYQDHRHRGLRSSPRQALGDVVSPRRVTASRLEDAFRVERRKKAHRKTGEVDFPQGTFLVPDALRGQALVFLVDPDPEVAPVVVEPGTGRPLPLLRAAIRPQDRASEPAVERWGQGPLQTLYDAWQGKVRPSAEPGFGLPELFVLLAEAAGRPVPRSDAEAALIQRSYRSIGPLPRRATEAALRSIGHQLGAGRPVSTYLDALAQRVVPASTSTKPTRRKKR